MPEYIGRHAGATALLIGKGPSLDAFLAGEHRVQLPLEGAIVVAFLNDTVAYRGDILAAAIRTAGHARDLSYYHFANDSIAPWVDLYHPGDILFQPRRTVLDRALAAPEPACTRVVYHDSAGDLHRLDLPPAQRVTRGLVAHHGTCDSAAQILHLMGCVAIVAIGLDGRGGRSARPWRTSLRCDHASDYKALRRDFETIALRLRVPVEFYGEPEILRRGRTITRTTLGTIFRGAAVPPNTDLPDATPAESAELIGAGRAMQIVVRA